MELKDIKKVACVGTGLIGSSWALGFSLKGQPVNVYDVSDEILDLAKKRVHESLAFLVKNDVCANDEIPAIEGRIHYTTSMEDAVKDAQFIQESGPERYDVKHSIVEEMEKYVNPEAIIASSTSGLLITEIAKHAKHPERFVGGHPYNPPHLIPLVEITKGEKTKEENVALAKAFYLSVGKEPVVLNKETLGFIANRLQVALNREVTELVCRGVCSVEDIDKAVTFGPGIRWGIMGPTLIAHLGGGKGGVDGLIKHLQESTTLWLADMADWKESPEEWPAIARKGVEEEMKNRPAEIGNDYDSLVAYRDNMLIKMLKLHKKL